jgi:hypothetical protein
MHVIWCRISENKIGRAINTFSYLIYRNVASDDPSVMFWALLGIEALYVEGHLSLQYQVNKKLRCFRVRGRNSRKSSMQCMISGQDIFMGI